MYCGALDHLSSDRRSIVPIGQLVCTDEAYVLAALLERLDSDVLQDILHPHPSPHRVRDSRRPPREPAS